MTSIDLLLANEIEDSLPKSIYCDLNVFARKLASPFGHPTHVSTQVQLASTCDYLLSVWPGLKVVECSVVKCRENGMACLRKGKLPRRERSRPRPNHKSKLAIQAPGAYVRVLLEFFVVFLGVTEVILIYLKMKSLIRITSDSCAFV